MKGLRHLSGLALVALAGLAQGFILPPGARCLACGPHHESQQGLIRHRPSALKARLSKEEEEEERLVQEELQRKIKGLYNAEGKPYAPWLLNQVDLEASARAIRARRAREKAQYDATGAISDPQGMESSVGLKYRIVNERDVELGWLTGEEKDNAGFLIFRRRADEPGAEFEEVASYKSYPPLNSKGPQGGTYFYTDEAVEPGQYLYRVSDEDRRGKRTVLCQVGLEVQSTTDKIKNAVLVGGFAALFIGGAIASVLIDNVK